MLDHLSLGVSDLPRAVAFSDAALALLGYVRLWEHERGAGYGRAGSEDGPLRLRAEGAEARPPGPGWRQALAAPSRAAVDAFHVAALAAGGADEGGPGLRPHYGPGYDAAFVRDPDGHRLEAVHARGAGPVQAISSRDRAHRDHRGERQPGIGCRRDAARPRRARARDRARPG